MIDLLQCLRDERHVVAVGDQNLCLAVIEREGNRRGIQPCVQRIQYGPKHGGCVVRLDHFRHVGGDNGDRVEPIHAK